MAQRRRAEDTPPQAPPGSAAAAFRTAWRSHEDPATATVELLPVRLAKACAAVLPVDGAGLSLFELDFRVPIGASDEMSSLAERLQFTQGEGPCLDAAQSRRSLTVDEDEMAARWPTFATELSRHTPFRAIASLPLAVTPKAFGAFDLYFVDPASLAGLRLPDVAAITAQISEALAAAVELSADVSSGGAGDEDDGVLPTWLDTEPARNRTYVWVAMGMMMTQFRVSAVDAVALLRAFAYGHDRTLDDVAVELVKGRLDLGQLQP